MTGQVQGKVALVTGGASGIGAAVSRVAGARGRVRRGHRCRRSEGSRSRRADQEGRRRGELSRITTSPARSAGSKSWPRSMKRYGRLDVLVSNAGIGICSAVDHRDVAGGLAAADRDQSRRRVPAVKHCLPAMRKTGGGSIIMMSSLAGLRGAAGLSGYCATKGGVRLFAKAIAMECAHVRRRHPRQLGASRHHRHADLGQDSDGSRRRSGQNAPIDPEERAKTGDAARPRRARRWRSRRACCIWRPTPRAT